MKNNISTNSRKGGKPKTKIQHAFRGIREPVCIDASQNQVLNLNVLAGQSTATAFVTLSPYGIKAPALTVSGTNVVVSGQTLLVAPSMRWLYNTAQNFGKYRVTRATMIFVGNVGTTTSGQLVMTGFRDVSDATINPQIAFATGPNARVFDLSSSGTKELKVQLPVDSSWKKVSATIGVNGTTTPFLGFSNQLVTTNSVNDLAFAAFTAQLVGFPTNSGSNSIPVGSFFIDYDVEFGEPESNSLNY